MTDERRPPELDGVHLETLRGLLEAIGGDHDFLAELVDEFATDGRAQVAAMRRAVAAADTTALTRAVHTLKSTAATFGAHNLVERCRGLEADARRGDVTEAETVIMDLDAGLEEAVALLLALRRDDVGDAP